MTHLKSISSRLTLAATLSVGVFGLVVALVTIEWVHADLDRSMRLFARHEVHEVSNIVASAANEAELRLRAESLAGLAPEPGLISLGVYGLDGRLVHGWPQASRPYLGAWPDGLRKALHGGEVWREVTLPDRPPALEVAAPVTFAREPRWLITIAVDQTHHKEEIRAYVQRFALGLLVVVLLTGLGTHVLVRQALAPVQRLVRDARLMAEESHPTSRLSAPSSADELAELAALVNRLLDRLSGTIQRLEQFTAHAGHELRTPLSRIRADAEQALSEADPAVLHGTLRSVLEEVDIQKRVIDALFELARSSEQLRLDEEPSTALDEIVRECVEDVEPLAEARGLTVTLDISADPPDASPDTIRVRGNRVLLVRAIWNVLDNAIKYAAAGEIAVKMRDDGAAVELSVTNAIAADREMDPTVAFEPFVRMSGEDAGDGGLGLGLALTRSIIERHQGFVRFEATEPGALLADGSEPGTRHVSVSLRLPRATSDSLGESRAVSAARA